MKIIGFGACMINGYMLGSEKSFFNIFVDILERNKHDFDEAKVFSFPAFPITRVEKYVEKKILPIAPNIVVVQFGTTDVALNLQKKVKQLLKLKENSRRENEFYAQRKSQISTFRWTTKNIFLFGIKWLISRLIHLKPVTAKETYINSMECILKQLITRDIKVIILSPFPQADFANNELVKKYTSALRNLIKRYDVIYIDSYNILNQYKYSRFLLEDGYHLSESGHQIIANAIYNEYINSFQSNE